METTMKLFIIICILAFTINVEARTNVDAKADKFKMSARCAQWAHNLDRDGDAKLHFKIAHSKHDASEINFQVGYALGIIAGAQIFSSKPIKELSLILYKKCKCTPLLSM